MGYACMAFALACWVVLAFTYRWAGRRDANRLVMSIFIGCAAATWAVGIVLLRGMTLVEIHPSQYVVGAGGGVVFAVLLPIFMAAVRRGDISITWMVLTLSFSLSGVLSVIYPGERLTPMGVTGLTLAATAVVLLGLDMRERHRTDHPGKPRRRWGFFMAFSFVLNGLTQYSFKLAAHFQPTKSLEQGIGNVLALYVTMIVTGSLIATTQPRRGSTPWAAATGAVAGTCLCLGGIATVTALSVYQIPAHLLFPTTAGGSSVMVVVISVIFLKERPGRFGWSGIVVGAAALTSLGLAA